MSEFSCNKNDSPTENFIPPYTWTITSLPSLFLAVAYKDMVVILKGFSHYLRTFQQKKVVKRLDYRPLQLKIRIIFKEALLTFVNSDCTF